MGEAAKVMNDIRNMDIHCNGYLEYRAYDYDSPS